MTVSSVIVAVLMLVQRPCGAIQSVDVRSAIGAAKKHPARKEVAVSMTAAGVIDHSKKLHKRAEHESAAADDLDASLEAKSGMIKQTEINKCIALQTSASEDGETEQTLVEVVDCSTPKMGTVDMVFEKNSDHQIKLKAKDLCLQGNALPRSTGNKGAVFGRTCVASTNPEFEYQKWLVSHDTHQVKLSGTELCLEGRTGQSVVSLATCTSSVHQKFQILAETEANEESLEQHEDAVEKTADLIRRAESTSKSKSNAIDHLESTLSAKKGMVEATETKKCVEAVESSIAGEEVNELALVKCDSAALGTANVLFELKSKQIRLVDRSTCLQGSVTTFAHSKGTVVARTCVASTEPEYAFQQWEIKHDDHEVKLKDTNLCMDARPGQEVVSLKTCSSGSEHQKFQLNTIEDAEDAEESLLEGGKAVKAVLLKLEK